MPQVFNNLGINLSTTKIQVVETLNEGDKFRVENIDEEHFENLISFDEKEARLVDVLQSAFNEILLRKTPLAKNVAVALPAGLFKVFQTPFDSRLLREELRQQQKWEFEKLVPYENAEDFILREIQVEKFPLLDYGELCTIALKRKFLIALHRFFARNKFKLNIVDHSQLALIPIFKIFYPDEKLILSIQISDLNFSAMLLNRGKPLIFKSFKIEDVSQFGSKINLMMKEISNRGIDAAKIQKAFLSGDGISDSILSKINDEFTFQPVKMNPFNNINFNESLKESKYFSERYFSFASAFGISLRLA